MSSDKQFISIKNVADRLEKSIDRLNTLFTSLEESGGSQEDIQAVSVLLARSAIFSQFIIELSEKTLSGEGVPDDAFLMLEDVETFCQIVEDIDD